MEKDVDLISILYSALENALYRMEEMELQMEGEWGLGKNLTNMEKDGEARAVLAKVKGVVND